MSTLRGQGSWALALKTHPRHQPRQLSTRTCRSTQPFPSTLGLGVTHPLTNLDGIGLACIFLFPWSEVSLSGRWCGGCCSRTSRRLLHHRLHMSYESSTLPFTSFVYTRVPTANSQREFGWNLSPRGYCECHPSTLWTLMCFGVTWFVRTFYISSWLPRDASVSRRVQSLVQTFHIW